MKSKFLKTSLLMSMMAFFATTVNAQIEGYWKGDLNLGAQQLGVCFNIQSKDGKFVSTMDVPAQGAFDVDVDETSFSSDTLKIEITAINASYCGVYVNDTLKGTFTQMGIALPLNLVKSEKEAKKSRPQDPKEPFNYRAENVTFRNEKENFSLAGTLTIPEGEGPFPAVVLVSGSGQQNRDEEVMNHRPFWVIADFLSRNGVAVLRYDDRGEGQSEGDPKMATTMDLSYDAEAAFDFLLKQRNIDATEVGILGHSEGGAINCMVASRRKDVAFIVSLAGPAVKGMEVIKAQQEAIYRVSGVPQEAIDAANQMTDMLYGIIGNTDDREQAASQMKTMLAGFGMPEETIAQTVDPLTSPWMFYFLKYDPTEAIANTNCPTLLLNGSLDLQVLASQNLPAYEKIASDYGKSNMTIREFPGLNHLFQHCTTGSPNEYVNIDETISPEVLQTILEFIKGN